MGGDSPCWRGRESHEESHRIQHVAMSMAAACAMPAPPTPADHLETLVHHELKAHDPRGLK